MDQFLWDFTPVVSYASHITECSISTCPSPLSFVYAFISITASFHHVKTVTRDFHIANNFETILAIITRSTPSDT